MNYSGGDEKIPHVKLIELQPGDVLLKDVVDYAGRLLITKGTVLNSEHIYKLSRRNVATVEIEDRSLTVRPPKESKDRDGESAPDARAIEKEIKLIDKSLRKRIPKIQGEQNKIFSDIAVSTVNPSLKTTLKADHPEMILERSEVPGMIPNDLALKAALFYDTLCMTLPESNWQINYKSVTTLVNGILKDLFSRENAPSKLRFNTAHPRRYNSFHALNCCLLGAILAKKMGFSEKEMQIISRALFLHDIGKVTIPSENVRSSVSLTDNEMMMARKHPLAGFLVLKGNPQIEEAVLLLAKEHHERYDGSGYPNHLAGERISVYGRLGAIIDVFDAMTSDRPYRRKVPQRVALQEILNHINVDFDPEISRLFVSSVGYYPTGCVVELSNKNIAVVTGQVANSLMRPIVRVLYDKNEDEPVDEVINLSENFSVSISDTLA